MTIKSARVRSAHVVLLDGGSVWDLARYIMRDMHKGQARRTGFVVKARANVRGSAESVVWSERLYITELKCDDTIGRDWRIEGDYAPRSGPFMGRTGTFKGTYDTWTRQGYVDVRFA